MLTDEVVIKIKAGNGGKGSASLHREKYQPRGGPDGGDGGNGGDVIIQVSPDVNTLTFFDNRKEFKAPTGGDGSKNRCHGANAEDLILKVPIGTIIYEIPRSRIQDSSELETANKDLWKIADLKEKDQKIVIAKGGRGGWGNTHFATATHQTPLEFNPGKPGVEKNLKLELQLIADVGLIGLPNVGKSTLLSRISAARPKIADYPFTTLEPNLGIVRVEDFSFAAADIPGLIEGASKGKGLGHKFLRHVNRTKILVHLIDSFSQNPLKDYKIIRKELSAFSKELTKKPEIVVVSRVDLLQEKEQRSLYAKISKLHPNFISTVTGRGINDLLYKIKNVLQKA